MGTLPGSTAGGSPGPTPDDFLCAVCFSLMLEPVVVRATLSLCMTPYKARQELVVTGWKQG